MTLTFAESPHGVHATSDRLVAALRRRELTLFARIDHGGAARAAGLELPDEELLIFGDPRAGTLLMQADPEVGYELPLRVLVWDAAGRTHIGYRPPSELAERYGVESRAEVLDRMSALLQELVAEALRDGS
jgi:beta-galactosidase